MKAIQFDRFGGTEVLHEADVEVPQPGPGQVRVQVMAAGVNALDGKIRSGVLQAVFPTTLPVHPRSRGRRRGGRAGRRRDGREGGRRGGWLVGHRRLRPVRAGLHRRPPSPPTLTGSARSRSPVAGETAERVLKLLGVARGETVLIHGAAGAVGTVAVQLAVARGARVIGTAGADNQDYVASLGATATVYGDGLVERVRALAPDGVDAVLDVAGKGALEDSITLRGGTDRIVTLADFGAHQLGVTFATGTGERSADRLAALAQDAATGKLVTTVTAYPLAQAATAQQVSDSGHVRGKLVLTLD